MRFYSSSDIFETSARLVPQGGLLSPDELMRRARARAFDPTIFEGAEPIFFPILLSNNQLDAYYTRMAPSSLRNYAQDAEAGVSFQDSHRQRELGLGATLSGSYAEDGDTASVRADVFTLPGLPDTDTFLFKLRAGIARDVSVGFFNADYRCSICARDLFDWDCPHIPGLSYEVEDRDGVGNVIRTTEQVAFAWVENARLCEVSIVYDGATPGCGVLKATRDIEAGRLTPALAERFTIAYRGLTLPGMNRLWPGYDKGERTMPTKSTTSAEPDNAPALVPGSAEQPEQGDRAPQAAPARLLNDGDEMRTAIADALRDAQIEETDPAKGLAEMARLARMGRQYRGDLIEETLTEGVRLYGNEFARETYRAMLAAASIEQIRTILADWRKQAEATIPAGRKTTDDVPADDEPRAAATADDPVRRLIPGTAFGG